MTRKRKRILTIGSGVSVFGIAAGLLLWALSGSVAFFNSPSEIVASAAGARHRIQLGRLVEEGTLERGETVVRFNLTDTLESVPVVYQGLLPDLFHEGQGVVTEGALGLDRVFLADTVLAKHDENYMPKEVVEDLKARGLWKNDEVLDRPATISVYAAAGAGT
ncbi:cytochrome c maturation protein CcmE [Aurantimonas coralicida]|jgi:cytochrome c-type biogenesis protein CcmE|uniref:cytochrome c maturation protein CcmE n=1 Tax=Aurantimonas coralicida TaxID=182270 RepID=UPI001D17E1CE|nr:cytochrome c maturation protein CcmE [Aurantimonas coralicida]MCC4300111.1 cytochrome c maturation protein CcmE [Aurantimonas coralicida]